MTDDSNRCPFEVGQWVTDGDDCLEIDEVYASHVVDWSRWTAFDPELVHRLHAQLWSVGEYRVRAEAAEARVKELKALLGRIQNDWHWTLDECEMGNAIRDALADD